MGLILLWLVFIIIFTWCSGDIGDIGVCAMISLVLVLVLTMPLSCIPFGEIETYNYEEHELRAVVDNYQYGGVIYNNIFVIRGMSDEKLQYQIMYKVDDKGWATKEIDARKVYLNFDCENPTYIIQKERYVNPTLRWLIPYMSDTVYILNLPAEATVIDSYVIDFAD
jgi:hypothetical protein